MNITKGKISEVLRENAITVTFPHGKLTSEEPDKLKGRLYEEKETGKRVLRIASGDGQILVGKEETIGNNIVRNFIVIRNKKTSKVKLVPIQNYVLSPDLPEETKTDISVVAEDSAKNLGQKFGSKKQQRVIEHYARMHTNAEALEGKLQEMTESMIVDTSLIEAPGDADKPTYLPPVRRDASVVEDAYNLYDILTPKELEILKVEAIKYITKPEERDQSLVTAFHEACIQNLSQLENDKDKIMESIAILIYINLLITFIQSSVRTIANKSYTSCPFSKEIHDRIMNDFTLQSTTGRTRPLSMRDKTICYIITLGLIINKFKMDVQPLSVTLQIPVKRLIYYSTLLGAINSPAKSTTVVLKVPLPPEVRKEPFRKRSRSRSSAV